MCSLRMASDLQRLVNLRSSTLKASIAHSDISISRPANCCGLTRSTGSLHAEPIRCRQRSSYGTLDVGMRRGGTDVQTQRTTVAERPKQLRNASMLKRSSSLSKRAGQRSARNGCSTLGTSGARLFARPFQRMLAMLHRTEDHDVIFRDRKKYSKSAKTKDIDFFL